MYTGIKVGQWVWHARHQVKSYISGTLLRYNLVVLNVRRYKSWTMGVARPPSGKILYLRNYSTIFNQIRYIKLYWYYYNMWKRAKSELIGSTASL